MISNFSCDIILGKCGRKQDNQTNQCNHSMPVVLIHRLNSFKQFNITRNT